MRHLACTLALLCFASTSFAEETRSLTSGKTLPLIVHEDFSEGADRWEPTDESAWVMKEEQGKKIYSLIKKKSNFNPPVRSPFNRSLLKDVVVSDFVLEVKFRSTIDDYPHRSLCLFFGYQDDSHLHYVHFGKRTDDHANQIFIVNDAPRTKISLQTTDGTNWDDEWHTARITRNTSTGEILVYFDDMTTPVMKAVDKTFLWGRIGIGSFDDTGDYAEVKLFGTKVEKP